MDAVKYGNNLPQRAHELFAPATLNALFWRPRFITKAPVMQHVAFLFWLVGAIRPQSAVVCGVGDGAAQFAICQAMDKLNIDGHCLGMGFWRDPKTGSLVTEVPKTLRDHGAQLYDDIAQWRCHESARDALSEIAPGSLDLLFVDACNLSEADQPAPVEDWFKCLDSDGVLLVHGPLRPFGDSTWKGAFEGLLAKHSSMSFPDEEGLLLVSQESGQSTPLRALLAACRHCALPGEIGLLFRRLGQGHLAVARTAETIASNKRLTAALTSAKKENDEAQSTVRELRDAYDARSRKFSEVQTAFFHQESHLADLKQQLAAAQRDGAKAKTLHDTERKTRFRETAALTRKLEAHAKEIADAQAELADSVQQIDALKQQLEELKTDNLALTQRIEDLLASTSWRMTAPLRSLKGSFGRH